MQNYVMVKGSSPQDFAQMEVDTKNVSWDNLCFDSKFNAVRLTLLFLEALATLLNSRKWNHVSTVTWNVDDYDNENDQNERPDDYEERKAIANRTIQKCLWEKVRLLEINKCQWLFTLLIKAAEHCPSMDLHMDALMMDKIDTTALFSDVALPLAKLVFHLKTLRFRGCLFNHESPPWLPWNEYCRMEPSQNGPRLFELGIHRSFNSSHVLPTTVIDAIGDLLLNVSTLQELYLVNTGVGDDQLVQLSSSLPPSDLYPKGEVQSQHGGIGSGRPWSAGPSEKLFLQISNNPFTDCGVAALLEAMKKSYLPTQLIFNQARNGGGTMDQALFFSWINRAGRKLLTERSSKVREKKDKIPLALWPVVLERAGKLDYDFNYKTELNIRNRSSVIFYFLKQLSSQLFKN